MSQNWYIPQVPDYYKPPDNYQVPDEYPNYWEELEDDNKRERGEYDEQS